MSIVSVSVGIDVSKDVLDVSIGGAKAFRVANSAVGFKELAGRLPKESVIHLESSGGYERLPRRFLKKAGFSVQTHDPLKVRRMAQAKAKRAKTDALDAKHLASECGCVPIQTTKSQTREGLCDLSRSIQEIKAQSGHFKVRAKVAGLDKVARQAYLSCAAMLDRKIQTLEKEYVKRVKASDLKEKYELALSIPGVGPCLARIAVAELPENIGDFTIAQLTAYAGVAPMDNSSGKKQGSAKIQQGNSHIKGALYMPALYCVGHQSWAKDLYARLRAKGRIHKQAAIAVMRRLLMRVVEVIQRGTPWEVRPEPKT
jgi:transposase